MSLEQPELIEVQIIGLPLDIQREAAEHQDGLQREFAMIAQSADRDSVPVRLLALIDALNERFQAFGSGPQSKLEEALESDAKTVDLFYQMPAAAAEGARELGEMLDAADEYCREGKDLLTLVTPPIVVAFRNWFLEEFIRQIQGHEPRAWERPES